MNIGFFHTLTLSKIHNKYYSIIFFCFTFSSPSFNFQVISMRYVKDLRLLFEIKLSIYWKHSTFLCLTAAMNSHSFLIRFRQKVLLLLLLLLLMMMIN